MRLPHCPTPGAATVTVVDVGTWELGCGVALAPEIRDVVSENKLLQRRNDEGRTWWGWKRRDRLKRFRDHLRDRFDKIAH